jgi:hypothetical protein
VIQSLTNASALANGAMADFGIPAPGSVVPGAPAGTSPMPRAFPYGLAVAGAGVTAGAVQLQGSMDAQNWYPVGSPVSFAAPGTSLLPNVSPNVPARYLRVIVSTAFSGGTVNAYCDAAP